MSNKNTMRLRRATNKAGKAGQTEYAESLPTHAYHNYDSGIFAVRRVPTGKANKDGVVSSNPRRNTQERVLRNAGGGSITSHESIDKSAPVIHKNHAYMHKDEKENNNYFQPKTVR
jgi:hypothetical protein